MGIYWNDLQAAVQQWLAMNGKFKNLEQVCSVSEDWESQLFCWDPEEEYMCLQGKGQ